jgi:BED zinc finger
VQAMSTDAVAAPAAAELPFAEARSQWRVEKPTGCTSEWWQYFSVYTLLRMAGVAICNICRAEVPRGGSSSTSGLKVHIVNQHLEYYKDNVLRKLKSKPGAMDRYTVTNPDFIDCFLKWLVRQPLSVAESPYFQRMLASLSSKVSVPSRSAITTKLIELQLQIQEAIRLLVVGLFVACTTDAWTSVANITFCSLTLHFITSSWQLVCLSLDCCSFPGSHTGERVAAKLNELLASYGIAKDHVMACVTDTASNMKKAARFMEYDWMGCMAHQLELVTGLAFKGIGVKDALKQPLCSAECGCDSTSCCSAA